MTLNEGQGAEGNAPAKPSVETGVFFTTSSPVEKYCAVGSPLIMEWKGKRYRTLMRGAKLEMVATNLTGQKARLAILMETSYFLADMPRDYLNAGFEFNSPLTVRFLNAGKVYAFRTTLMRVHNQPPVMVLEYPEKVEYHNMRSDERVGIIFPTNVSGNGGSVNRMGAVVDLSASGARLGLDTREGINVGTSLCLSFTLPSGSAVTDISVLVRNISEESGKYLLGASFLRHEPAVRAFCHTCSECLE